MLIHLSLNAHDPDAVASGLAELLDAVDIAAPSPPFRAGTRMVCRFDDRGTMVEVAPIDVGFAPGPTAETTFVATDAPDRTGFHGLFLTAVPQERIKDVAARYGWACGEIDNGPFKVINVWLENRQLIELTTPQLVPDYLALYGPANRDHLDAQLRGLEQHLRSGADREPSTT